MDVMVLDNTEFMGDDALANELAVSTHLNDSGWQ